MNVYIHSSAIVDHGAQVGEGTKIWHFTHVSSSAIIGNECSLGQNVYIGNHVSIGNGVKIQNNVSVYEGVILHDDVFCGSSMVFTNDSNPRSAFQRDKSINYQKTVVGRGVSIGANATIVCGVTIGEWAFVAPGTVIKRDIPPYSLYAGAPARQVGWICKCGVNLAFRGGHAKCKECDREYQLDQDRVTITKH
ncbi:acyltransferase [Paenibacillus segetis]|uniref:N-acetyltransferase n=1 Tax=Paenibacillus segetis TaxID=1325360 RepID=A0ABQ1YSP4_9BACL|nr:acyltransferase [Paenibacillus segetis]GGH37358.1 N-acetyltransferase [Paenibacillus segetis]